MRRANEAVVCERFPIPTVDEILHDMNGSTVFSCIDLKWGYHQLELSPESRDITAFATHSSLFQYKKLLFGLSSASEQYQHEISRVIAGVSGAAHILDDIIVHGADESWQSTAWGTEATEWQRSHYKFKEISIRNVACSIHGNGLVRQRYRSDGSQSPGYFGSVWTSVIGGGTEFPRYS